MTLPFPTPAPDRLARALLRAVVPYGGQGRARRNAWAGMSADTARRRDRVQAQAAVSAAVQRAHARTG